MDKGEVARCSVAGISLLVFISALALAFGIGLSTAPSVRAQSANGDLSWTVSSSTDWWDNSSPDENDVRTTIHDGSLRLTGENMLGYWSMDDFPSGFGSTDNTVYDVTSLNHNGVAENGLNSDNIVSGKWDNALTFDGTDDLIDTNYNLNGESRKGVTISLWVKYDAIGDATRNIFCSKDSNELEFRYNNSGTTDRLGWFTYDGNVHGIQYDPHDPSTDTWYHYTATYDNDTGYKLYINGDNVASSSDTTWATDTADEYIAHRTDGGETPFDGIIDEVMIFNRALGDNEVKRIYNRTQPPSMVGDNLKAGEWKSSVWDTGSTKQQLDNVELSSTVGTGENLYANLTVYDNGGSQIDNTGWTDVEGVSTWTPSVSDGYQYSMGFKLQTDNTTHSPSVSSFTVNTSNAGPTPITVSTNPAENIGYTEADLSGTLENLGGNSSVDNVGFFWKESSSSTWSKVVSKQNVSTAPKDFSYPLTSLSEGTTYDFKAFAENSTYQDNGSVKSFTTNSRDWIVDTTSEWWENDNPSENDVRVTIDNGKLKLTGENAYGWWSLDRFPPGFGSTDNTVYDLTSDSINGTAENGTPTIISGKWDNALSFDPSENAWINFGNFSKIAGDYTIFGWVRFDDFNIRQDAIGSRQEARMEIYDDGINQYSWVEWDSSGGTGIGGPKGLSTGTWYFVTFVGDSSAGEIRLYHNGNLENSASLPVGEIGANDNPFHLGGNSGGYQNYFRGDWDEVGYLDEALTENQIVYIMNRTKPPSMVGDNLKAGEWTSVVHDFGDNYSLENFVINENYSASWGKTLENALDTESYSFTKEINGQGTDPLVFRTPSQSYEYWLYTQNPNGNNYQSLYKSNDYDNDLSNWILENSDVTTVTDGSGTNFQTGYLHDNGDAIILQTVNDSWTRVYKVNNYNFANPENLGELCDNYDLKDTGIYYEDNTWYVYAEGPSAGGDPTSNYIYLYENADSGVRGTYENMGTVLDVSGESWDTGDPEVKKISDNYYMFSDYCVGHPSYYLTLSKSGSPTGTFTLQSPKQKTSVKGGDAEPENTEDGWKTYTEFTGDDEAGIGLFNIPSGDTVIDHVEFYDGSGNLIENYTENISSTPYTIDLTSVSGTYSDVKVSMHFKTYSTSETPVVDSYTLNVSEVPNVAPNIESISVDNTLVDRDLDYSDSGATTATKITVRVRDNDNRSDIAPLRFSLRDNNDSLLVDNVEVTENSVVDENTLDFTYTFDPSDTLADDNLGKFDVRSEARDNYGACHVENFLELGHKEFTVTDRIVENIAFENDYEHVLKVTADSARVVGPAASVTSSTLTDNNLGDYSMGSDLAVSYKTTQDGNVTVKATDGTVDGISSSKSYTFPNFHPSIVSVSVDNTLIDKDQDYPSLNALDKVIVTVRWSDPDNRTNDLDSGAQALLSVRDNRDSEVFSDHDIISSRSAVDENTVDVTYDFDVSDSLPDDNMGRFDVKFRGIDRYGMENLNGYGGLGHGLFAVDDRKTTINYSPEQMLYSGDKVTIGGKVSGFYEPVSLDNVVLKDSVDGTFRPDILDDDSWEMTYSVSQGRHEVTVGVLDKGSRLDGSETLRFDVESGKNQPSFNPTEQNLNVKLQVGLYQGREPTKGGRIEFEPSSRFRPGDKVTVVAYLTANGVEISHADITGSWNGNSFPLGDKKANRFVGTFTIPKDTKPGSYLVSVDASARGLQSTASKTITVQRAKKGINLVKLIKDYWWVIVIIIILLLIVLE